MRNETRISSERELNTLQKLAEVITNELVSSERSLGPGEISLIEAMMKIRHAQYAALSEIGQKAYGRAALVDEYDEEGLYKDCHIFRITQANMSCLSGGCNVVARNSPVGRNLVSVEVGEEFDIRTPGGTRWFHLKELVDLEGPTPPLRLVGQANFALGRFALIEHSEIDVVRDLRDYISREGDASEPALSTPTIPAQLYQPRLDERFWPSHWDNVLLGDGDEVGLGSKFFTQTTKDQENLIQRVRGSVFVEGIGGTGKTSAALGRLKFFANFSTAQDDLSEFELRQEDVADFEPDNMIGFVLSPSLRIFLKSTAEELSIPSLPIQDFEDFFGAEVRRRGLASNIKRVKQENPVLMRSLTWLTALDRNMAATYADILDDELSSELKMPDTEDSKRIKSERWQQILDAVWRNGPTRRNLNDLLGRIRDSTNVGRRYVTLGLAEAVYDSVSIGDYDDVNLQTQERNVVTSVLENLRGRLLRALRPRTLYEAALRSDLFQERCKRILSSGTKFQAEDIEYALAELSLRKEEGVFSNDDLVAVLCMASLIAEGYTHGTRQTSYLTDTRDCSAVFIDEVQDFSEQQVFLMARRAITKYNQVTASGDLKQRLNVSGLGDVRNVMESILGQSASIFLDRNMRQSEAMAALSSGYRRLIQGDDRVKITRAVKAPVVTYERDEGFAEYTIAQLATLPSEATVAIICANQNDSKIWFDLMEVPLAETFRQPSLSRREELTRRFQTHFTVPQQTKGLEFDAVIIPDLASFGLDDDVGKNGLYVALSRPRHAIILGCRGRLGDLEILAPMTNQDHLVDIPVSDLQD